MIAAETDNTVEAIAAAVAASGKVAGALEGLPEELAGNGASGVGIAVPEAGGSGTPDQDALRSFSKTSVLFVSISFIILMVISLAWLVFYYVQRFRYAHAKDRLQRRLFNAAKKALAKMPAKSLRNGDNELEGDCAVCIDPYAIGDIVRTLPCRHIFHKTCIDPWLLEHRTCPMCKADILKAYGLQIHSGDKCDRERQGISPDHSSFNNHDEADVRVLNGNNNRVRVESHPPLTASSSSSTCSSNGRGSSPTPSMSYRSATRAATAAIFIERVRPVRENSWTSGVSLSTAPAPPSSARSSSHIVNLVHVRARSASCAPRAATFRAAKSSTACAASATAAAAKGLNVSPEKAPALIAVATTQFPERSATSTQIDVIDETEILQ